MNSKTLSQEAKIELAKRELARRSIRHYVNYVFGDGYIFGAWHDDFFEKLEAVRKGKITRLMVFLPPRSGKSEIISKLFPSFILGESPAKNIVCASYGADLAKEFGRKTRAITKEHRFKNVFPSFSLSDDKREGGDWETKEGGGYYSIGVQGALTGKGYDIGMYKRKIAIFTGNRAEYGLQSGDVRLSQLQANHRVSTR